MRPKFQPTWRHDLLLRFTHPYFELLRLHPPIPLYLRAFLRALRAIVVRTANHFSLITDFRPFGSHEIPNPRYANQNARRKIIYGQISNALNINYYCNISLLFPV